MFWVFGMVLGLFDGGFWECLQIHRLPKISSCSVLLRNLGLLIALFRCPGKISCPILPKRAPGVLATVLFALVVTSFSSPRETLKTVENNHNVKRETFKKPANKECSSMQPSFSQNTLNPNVPKRTSNRTKHYSTPNNQETVVLIRTSTQLHLNPLSLGKPWQTGKNHPIQVQSRSNIQFLTR